MLSEIQRLKMIHATLIDHVAETLREEILSGAIEPGTRLRQDDIAQKLGVSHIPVREAFRQLGSEGLVRIEATPWRRRYSTKCR